MGAVLILDILTRGPCDADLSQQVAKRMRFHDTVLTRHSSRLARRRLRSSTCSVRYVNTCQELHIALRVFDAKAPVVIWTTPNWEEQLLLCWLCDSLREQQHLRNRLWYVESAVSSDKNEFVKIASQSGKELANAFTRARRLGAELRRRAGTLWRAYAGPSPVRFDRLRRRVSYVLPWFMSASDVIGAFFPRWQRGRLWLSEFDATLLKVLANSDWVRPYDVVRGSHKWHSFNPSPFDILRRLRDWEEHCCDAPAITCKYIEGANELTSVAFQITKAGRRLIVRGIESLDVVPALTLGGWTVSCQKQAWVRSGSHNRWQIERVRL